MKLRTCIAALTLPVLFSCTNELEKEREAYQDALKSFDVSLYKSAKTILRATSTVNPESTTIYGMFNVENDSIGQARELMKWVNRFETEWLDTAKMKEAETTNYVKLASDIWSLNKVIGESDEDRYPLFLQRVGGQKMVHRMDSTLAPFNIRYSNSAEHAVMGTLSTLSFQTMPHITLYELSEVSEEELGNNELLFFTSLLRAFNFSLQNWNYLAEEEATLLLRHLEERPYSTAMFELAGIDRTDGHTTTQAAQDGMYALSYTMRAYTRFRIGEEDKKKDAADDIILAVEYANKAGIQNDYLTLTAAAYSMQAGNEEKTLKLADELAAKSADPYMQDLGKRVGDLLRSGDEKQANAILSDELEHYNTIFLVIKDVAWHAIDKEGHAKHLSEKGQDNPLGVYFDFIQFYMAESGQWKEYATMEYYEQKINNLFK